MLFFKGKIEGVKRGEYESKPTCSLQFIIRHADGSLDSTKIKVPETMPNAQFQVGQDITLPILCSTMNGIIYYRVDADAYKQTQDIAAKR